MLTATAVLASVVLASVVLVVAVVPDRSWRPSSDSVDRTIRRAVRFCLFGIISALDSSGRITGVGPPTDRTRDPSNQSEEGWGTAGPGSRPPPQMTE